MSLFVFIFSRFLLTERLVTDRFVLLAIVGYLGVLAPLFPCIASIAFASEGHTADALQAHVFTLGTLLYHDWVRHNPTTVIQR